MCLRQEKMKLKSILFRLPPIPLGYTVTIYFVGFGIFIGYLSFIIITVSAARSNTEMAYQTIIPIIKEITGKRGEDFIIDLINTKNQDIVRLHNAIQRSSSAFGRIAYTIYFLRKGDTEWKKLYLGSDGIFREQQAGEREELLLDKARVRRFHHSYRVFFDRSDRVSLYMLLPLKNARNAYILSLEMDREGIALFIRNNVNRFLVFGAVLLLISMVLGKLFSRRIAGPIKKLSLVAQARAEGNQEQAFTLTRRDEIGVLADSLNTMTREIDRHLREVKRRMITMETMNQIDKAVLSSISRSDLMDRIINLVSSLFGSGFTALLLYNIEQRGFELLSSRRTGGEGILTGGSLISEEDIGSDGIACLRNHFLVHPDETSQKKLLPILESISGDRVCSWANVPVYISDNYIGSLLLARSGRDASFSGEEVESAKMLGDQVGIALQSLRAFEEKERLLLGILLALTRTIDAKSKWTAGHSERVAMYSERIGVRLGMNEVDVRTLSFSAILHDIGKIGISERILDKPGKLTEDEYAIIKEHPATGARIISDIPSYESILPGILYHHEHWDGSGYPEGLRGEEIPLASRIITVADVFDAITADRPYRKGLRGEEAQEFMRSQSGALFDSMILQLLLEILHEEEMMKCPQ